MKVLFIDTETSGLFNYRLRADADGQPRMIQFAAALVDIDFTDGNPALYANIPILPDGWKMDDELAAKMGHGMTQDWLLQNGRPVAAALDIYEKMHVGCDMIAGFNIPFDQKGLRAELRRAGRNDHYAERPEFCLMRAMTPLAKVPKAKGAGWKFPKLIEAYRFAFNAEPEKPLHNAFHDVLATVKLFNWLREQGHDTVGSIPPKKLEGEEDDSERRDNFRRVPRQEASAEAANPAGCHDVGFLD